MITARKKRYLNRLILLHRTSPLSIYYREKMHALSVRRAHDMKLTNKLRKKWKWCE